MRSAADLLFELNSSDECPAIEAKRSREVGKSLLETVSAFSNEPGLGGGYLLLGITWEINLFGDRVYVPEGLDDPDKVQADLASQCGSVFNQVVRPEMSLERMDGKTVLVVYVPEAAAPTKPVYLKSVNLPRGAWRRIGSTDQRCTDEDIWALRGTDAPTESYDATLVPGAEAGDLDPEAVAEYRRLRTLANPVAEELRFSDDELLEAVGAVQRNNGKSGVTLAGLLLFGKGLALRRLLPAFRIDYIRMLGTEWIEDPERRFQSLDIRKPLLLAFRQAEAALADDLPKGFHLPEGSLQSIQEPILPLKVIRETIANALMHRSYRVHEPIQIIRFSNRIEVLNPGYSLKRQDELGQPGSRQRNPLIAAAFHDLHFAETKGSGIRSIRRLMEETGMAAPEFLSDRERDRFKAVLHLHHLFSEEGLTWLKQIEADSLGNDACKVLLFLRENEAVDNMTCRDLTGMDTLLASSLLRRLRDQGFLAKEGGGSRTYYVPGPALAKRDPHMAASDPHMAASDPHMPGGAAARPLPESLCRRLPEPGNRPRQAVIRPLILEICQCGPHSAKELAHLLGDRDPKELVRSHLNPMLEAGLLRYTIKDMPRHPEQRYAVAEPSRNP